MSHTDTAISATIAAASWLVSRGYRSLAIEMRDEFLRESEIPGAMWDERLEHAADYIRRKGDTPETSLADLEPLYLCRPTS